MTDKVHNEPWPEERSILVLQIKIHKVNIHERRHQDQTMGRDYQTLQIREHNCTVGKSRIGQSGKEIKHGCPSGPRGYVKAVMCSHSRVRVPLRAFFLFEREHFSISFVLITAPLSERDQSIVVL